MSAVGRPRAEEAPGKGASSFFVDKCRLELKPVAVILEDKELVRLLNHFGLPTEFPAFSPSPVQYAAKRGPPDEDCQLNPLADQYDNIDPPSPED